MDLCRRFVDVSTSVSRSSSPGLSELGSTSILTVATTSTPSFLNSTTVVKPTITPSTSVVTNFATFSSILSSTSAVKFAIASSSNPHFTSATTFTTSSSSSVAMSSAHPTSSFKPSSTKGTASKAPIQPTAGPGSTIVSGGITSTVTTNPTSTLSDPVVSTMTNSNGSQAVTTPALITTSSTSTNSNGTISTATAIVANPLNDLSPVSGILHNTGAVAGIFSAVGVVFTCLVFCMVIFVRRRRRDRQHEKWLAGMQAQRRNSFTGDPFHDENLPPVIHSILTNDEDGQWDRKSLFAPEGSSRHSQQDFGPTNTSIIPILPNGTFGQSEKQRLQSVDESHILLNKARHSWSPSTPSIYPASLSPDEERVSNSLTIVPISNQTVITSPPRPPRSRLRDRGTKVLRSGLPTPPESEYSHLTLSLVSEPHSVHILDKKPLDTQSRLSTP